MFMPTAHIKNEKERGRGRSLGAYHSFCVPHAKRKGGGYMESSVFPQFLEVVMLCY